MSAANEPAANARQLLHYQLGERLGEGGFGEVYRAWDAKLHRHVAIKYLKNIAPGLDLLKEARLAASLQHAAFVKVHALEQAGDSQAIVMELVPGRTLRQVFEMQASTFMQALEIVRQVAQAMQEAHAAGLIHGDLKPTNLMQEPSGAVRILDFGLAAQSDRDATTSLVQSDPQGTIAYMAPEILTGAALRPSADIYALGVILYELLTGGRPFAQLSGLALAAALMQSNSDQWPWPDTLPYALRQLIRAMTARSLEERIGSMAEVAKQCAQLQSLDSSSLHSVSLQLSSLNLAALPTQTRSLVNVDWAQLRKPLLKTLYVLLGLFALFCVWYSQPYWQQVSTSLKPYSESQEMRLGLQALDDFSVFERDDALASAEQHFNNILSHSPEHAAAVASVSLVLSSRYAAALQVDGQNSADAPDTRAWLQKAEQTAQQALKLNDLLALSHIAQAKVLALRGQYQPALSSFDAALALDPNNQVALGGKVAVLIAAQRLDEARALSKDSLQRFPQETSFANLLGQIEMLSADYKAAETAYTLSVKQKPDAIAGYLGLFKALSQQSRHDEGVQVLQAGVKVRPSAALYGALGKALSARGDYVAAAAALESAVTPEAGKPNDYQAWARLAEALAWLPGRNEASRKAYDKARELLQPRLIISPNNADLLSRMGLYAAKLGDASEAQTHLQKALTLAPNTPEVQFRAGVSYEIIGKRPLALAAILKAKQLAYPIKLIEADPELVTLRRDPQYLQQ